MSTTAAWVFPGQGFQASLGEFDALFAAGAFDFATGLQLVRKRALLAGSDYQSIGVANVNAADQIIISGAYDEIERCETQLAVYSTSLGGALARADADYFWGVMRRPVDFRRSLSAIKYGRGGSVAHLLATNQFGRNLQSVSKLFADPRSAS